MPVKRQTAGPSTGQKRTRFASPSPGEPVEPEDTLLEEDLPEGAAKGRSRAKRQLKDQNGYDSDSSNDDEGVVPSRRPDAKGDDDDVDMFAEDVEEKADAGKSKEKGKGKEFLDLDEIEGQEFDGRRDGTADEESGTEDEAKRRKEGLDGDMGVDITPFNMKSEMEEGRFTADGEAYVENERDPNDRHDVWLDQVDEEEIAKARKAHNERERLEREREEKEDMEGVGESEKERENDLMREAVKLLDRGETVLEALQRLGGEVEEKRKKDEAGNKKKSWAERQRERKAAAEAEAKQT